MTYAKGDLQSLTPISSSCKDLIEDEMPECMTPGHHHFVDDQDCRCAADDEIKLYPAVYLNHSLHEWVIGGPAEIKLLIADLQSALNKFATHAEDPS